MSSNPLRLSAMAPGLLPRSGRLVTMCYDATRVDSPKKTQFYPQMYCTLKTQKQFETLESLKKYLTGLILDLSKFSCCLNFISKLQLKGFSSC